jgi:hypothetical protein
VNYRSGKLRMDTALSLGAACQRVAFPGAPSFAQAMLPSTVVLLAKVPKPAVRAPGQPP